MPLCSPTSVCLYLGMLETVCGDLWQYGSCHVYCVYGCEKMKQIADVYYLCFDAVHLLLALAASTSLSLISIGRTNGEHFTPQTSAVTDQTPLPAPVSPAWL